MAELIRKILSGGINTDDDPAGNPPFPANDYLMAENIRFAGGNETFSLRRVNIKGTVIKTNDKLPTGVNTCLGAFEHKDGYSIITFNHNSDGNHGIYWYYSNTEVWVELLKTTKLNFLQHNLIHSVHLVNNELLYWVDGKEDANTGEAVGNPPRKINLKKANNLEKKKTFDLFFDTDTFFSDGATHTVTVIITNDEGTVIETTAFSHTVAPGTTKEKYQAFTNLLNSSVSNATYVSNGSYISATLNFIGGTMAVVALHFVLFFPVIDPVLVVPTNHYATDIPIDYIDRIKIPPLCHPSLVYGYDASFTQNLIVRKYFQFCVQYVFDDSERSVAGPYSPLAYITTPCGVDENDSGFNYITVDFTDSRLDDPKVLAVLKKVRIYVREGEFDPWKIAKVLERQDFGIGTNSFRFYNDGSYPIAPTDIYTIEDTVPLIATSETFVNDTGYLGGCKEGYDNFVTDGSLELTYEPQDCEQPAPGNVTGRLDIINGMVGGNHQPIHDYGDGVCFGGMTSGGVDIFAGTVVSNYRQTLKLRGFVVFLVSTTSGAIYYAKTVQNNPGLGVTILAGEGNVYNSNTISQRNKIRDAMAAGAVYSTYTISGVPPGKYIQRVASHYLDEDGTDFYRFPGDTWTNSSTYLKQFIGSPSKHEAIITVTSGGTTTQDIEIFDMVHLDALKESSVVSGYLVDALTSSVQADLLSGSRMERQKILVFPETAVHSYDGGDAHVGYTDHNGFFFFAGEIAIGGTINWEFSVFGVNSVVVKSSSSDFYLGDLNDLAAGTLTSTGGSYTVGNYEKPFILYNTTLDTQIKTSVDGTVKNNGVGVGGIGVICSKTNRFAITDPGGNFSILVYGDASGTNRTGSIIISHEDSCCTSYPSGQEKLFTITPFFPNANYSANFPYLIGDLLILITGVNNERRYKKRNLVDLYIQYSDYAGRLTRAVPLAKTYIPFVSEPGGNEGKPVLTYKLNHRPPLQAVKGQILKKKNSIYNRLSQWITGEVKYVKYYDTTLATPIPVETGFADGDATEIWISLLPYVQYINENAGAVVSFVPIQGDRLTIFRDPDNALLGFYDFPIENYKGTPGSGTDPLYAIIKFSPLLPELYEGFMVEYYSPKLKLEEGVSEDNAFEIGECFDILDPGTENRRHGAGTGGVDQILDVSPSTGILQNGDIYFRKRNMVIQSGGDKTYYNRDVEDEYIYDTDAKSKIQSVGRPNYEDKDYRQMFYKTRLRFDLGFTAAGNKIYNGHSNFRINDFVDLDTSFGCITFLARIGEAAEIMVIMKHKVQSLYTKRSPMYSVDGQQVVVQDSDTPLSLGRVFEENWGCQNPEGIIQRGNQLWAPDLLNSEIWAYSTGGLISISDPNSEGGRIKNLLLGLRSQLLKYDLNKVHIIGGDDRKYEELIWAFMGVKAIDDLSGGLGGGEEGESGDEDNDGIVTVSRLTAPLDDFSPYTISFSLKRAEWECTYSYFPECMIALGQNGLYSFKGGEAYLHDANATRNYFHGVQGKSSIKFVINEFTQTMKDFLFTSIISNKKWNYTLIEIMPNDTFPEGMQSRITDNNFEMTEGTSWADFFKDMTDPSFTDQLESLLNGRELKGFVMKITAENYDTVDVHVGEFAVGVIISPETT